jgi:plastocyanin
MATGTLVREGERVREPVSTLGKVSAASLAGSAVMLLYLMFGIIGVFIPPIAVFAVLGLIFAGVVMTGLRWAPLLSALFGIVLPVANAEGVAFELSRPDNPGFGPTVIILALCAVGVVAGVGSTIQNYRSSSDRRAPRWLAPALVGLTTFCVGVILMAGSVKAGASAGVSPETLASLPALVTKEFQFEQAEIRAKVGETVALRLENRDRAVHSFDIDELGVHAPIFVGEDSLALFRPTKAGTYTFYCAPHYNKATGEGMKGTLIVE